MSTLTALAKAQAVAAGRAQPIATVRHAHLSDLPLVFIPLTMAGEANAPLAAMVGTDEDHPELLIVPQPRDRAQRFEFASRLADILLPYTEGFCGATEAVPTDRKRDVRYRYLEAPQLIVPAPAGIGFIRLFGRSTRFRRTDGDYPVHPNVPLLGRWLTFFADRAEQPGSSMLLSMTDLLAAHWATGQSGHEDAHLGSLVNWIAPPPGSTGAAAARLAEDPEVCPPAGPATDPGFDNDVLGPAMDVYRAATEADDPEAERAAYRQLEDLLRGQLAPTWELMWRGLRVMRAIPPGASVEGRWAQDRDVFSDFSLYVQGGGAPQARRDGAVAAATRLHKLERAGQSYAIERAFDDPLIMAEHRLGGEAIVGEVTLSAPTRVDDTGKRPVLRPRVQVVTTDPVLFTEGTTLVSPSRQAQRARVVFVTPVEEGGKTEVVLELSGGMGRGLTAPPGSVPEVGERICYTSLSLGYAPPGTFPSREETPWTHGGPPQYSIADDPLDQGDHAATEDWS